MSYPLSATAQEFKIMLLADRGCGEGPAICQKPSYIFTSWRREGEEHNQGGRGREKNAGKEMKEKEQKYNREGAELLFINTAPATLPDHTIDPFMGAEP